MVRILTDQLEIQVERLMDDMRELVQYLQEQARKFMARVDTHVSNA